MQNIDKAALLGHNVRQASREDLRCFLQSLAAWDSDFQSHAPVLAADAYEAMKLKKAIEDSQVAQTSQHWTATLYPIILNHPEYQLAFCIFVAIAFGLLIVWVSGALGLVTGAVFTPKDLVEYLPSNWDFRNTQNSAVLFGFGEEPRVILLGFEA
ncbi:hypothetical protein F5B20DRAFT_256173 [Whalleya microplaca]|nr:hypothetical protein F5B20DRAFT_256173 [Whalleya microplaca]